MAGKETAERRKQSLLLQQERNLGFRTDRPFLFQVDGGNIPQLRKGESSKSFLKRIKDWENFTGRKYPTSTKLNRIKLRGTGGNKDYTGSNWEDEKREWVTQRQAASIDSDTAGDLNPRINPQLGEDIDKEEFLANPVAYEGTPTPINQDEINKRQLLINTRRANEKKNNIITSNETFGVPQVIPDANQTVVKKKVSKPQPWKNEGGYTPNAAELRRATGININDAKGKRAWQKLVNSNRVFDTTKDFGDDGGFFVHDNRGIPRFVKYQGG